MATVLDITLIEFVKPVFIFLFITLIIYALLVKTKFFGDSPGINAIISISVGFLLLLTPQTREVISFVTPWFVILLVFIILFALIFMAFGAKDESVMRILKNPGMVFILVIVVFAVIVGAGFSKAFGKPILPGFHGTTETDKEETFNFARIVFNARVLGALFILVIASYIVRYVSITS